MGQVPLTPISDSFTDLLCGLRHFPLISLGLIFPKKKVFQLLFVVGGGGGDAKRANKRCLLFKDAPMKCIRPFS